MRRMLWICPTRTDPMAATMSTAASVGIATTPTTPENATRITSIQIPEKIDAHRSTAPALTLRAVWPTDMAGRAAFRVGSASIGKANAPETEPLWSAGGLVECDET